MFIFGIYMHCLFVLFYVSCYTFCEAPGPFLQHFNGFVLMRVASITCNQNTVWVVQEVVKKYYCFEATINAISFYMKRFGKTSLNKCNASKPHLKYMNCH
ncbi:hypothetical protein KUTeg_011676 [Tegillarca granosa]|uniref:Secreted protein n=1 Tax=Tegillarca granosa TaxID=220873 RepID=A0ABQ9EZT8_TEGGR|nr:hypothetical protein KUTeg_011676 [Tegillarca granosa]